TLYPRLFLVTSSMFSSALSLFLSSHSLLTSLLSFFFFNDTATTEIYTLSLHDALPISFPGCVNTHPFRPTQAPKTLWLPWSRLADRKSTRLNSSHVSISYAVFCLKKKKKNKENTSYSTMCIIYIHAV